MQRGICNIPITCDIIDTGQCYQFEKLTDRKGKWNIVSFPASVMFLKHPVQGNILFDAGYSHHFFTATRKFPYRFYRWITPISHNENQSAVSQLREKGIKKEDIAHIILSHFHGDHTGGLKDFPYTSVYCSKIAYKHTLGKSGVRAVKHAHLPDTLPEAFSSRLSFIEDAKKIELPEVFRPFSVGYDIWGDGSMIVVELPGHAAGQIGVFFLCNDQLTLLCADATWSHRAIRERSQPHPLARLVMHDAHAFEESFEKLCELYERNPHVRIVPTHCSEKGRGAL